ncbi:class I SAM-dependent methyltransferase [Amnibacterium setariae]|uniref:Class I SAM-dependent methyltransferase n=1 Tax=Amnibacterium setariae TaxID=2306585 RepID=A0A3A1U1I3_9MICO|nr:class I SAM-dependent methyltransferase [Amnibacterium setariae]RIX30371.1 class I SAM-dependent methyltransferase [Amnibacterium setariae]
MERGELEALLSPRVLTAVDAEARPETPADVLARSTALRREGFSPEESAAILTQAALRRRARAKFGEFADRMLFTRAGLEQATRLEAAARHAARFRDSGAALVADLGCGLGGDALAMAALGLRVLAVERDEVTAVLAQYNLAPFPEATVRVEDAEAVDLDGVDAVWLDPARRTAGHDGTRRVAAADYSPSLAFADEVAARRPTGVKLSPAHDREAIPEDAEAQWVSDRGDVVELALWRGGLQRDGVRRAALVLGPVGAAELTAPADAEDEPVGPLGDHVHEPDGAVIRARLLGDVARTTGTHPVGPGIAYLSGDGPAASPFLTSFAVDAVLPFDRQRIRKELRARGIGRLEIKKRGVDLDPARFRKELGLSGDGEAVLVVTRTADRRVALLCRR